MPTKLDLTELNKLFNKPSPKPRYPMKQSAEDHAWLEQFYARVRFIEALNYKQPHPMDFSPSSSNATLVEEGDDFLDVFKVCKIEEPFFVIPNLDADIEDSLLLIDGYPNHLPEDTDMSSDTSSNHSPSSSISLNNFNPHAEPFVPTYTMSMTTSPPPLPCEISDVAWFPIFWPGVSSNDPEVHQIHAAALVDNIQWTTESLAVLSQHFCWKGAEGTGETLSGVAPFARVVHDQFREVYGDWYANCLTRHIRECVVGHFKACWKSDQPHSITYANPPSIAYLSSAQSLTTFIGDLYAHGLLPRSAIHHCLSVLVAELNSVEHIQAIHLLLLHANTKLWKGKDANKSIRDFVASFTQRASCLADNASILGNTFKKSEIRGWVKEITDMINRWQLPRRINDDAATKDLNAGDKVLLFGLHIGQRR